MLSMFFIFLIVTIGTGAYIYLHEEQAKTSLQKEGDKTGGEASKRNTESRDWYKFLLLFFMLIFTITFGVYLRLLAAGWLLVFLGLFIVYIPAIVHFALHTILIMSAKQVNTRLFMAAAISHIFLFLFLVIQEDLDDANRRSGLSILLNQLDLKMPAVTSDVLLWLAAIFGILLVASWITIYLLLFYKRSNKPKLF